MLASECSPNVLDDWVENWKVWFAANTIDMDGLGEVMCKVLKKSFPDLKRMTNLFRMQPHQPGESHADMLKCVELAVEFGGVET